MNWTNSSRLFKAAGRYIPGGVNSPVRAFRNVGGNPLFITRGKGSKIFDADGNRYVDYVSSWGPLILGHAHPSIIRAIMKAAAKGTSFGAPTEEETELARLIVQAMPSIEMVRLVSSGTEAAMSAIRVARGYTNRDQIIKFAGCYHGHSDGLLVKAGSGATTFGTPDSAGVPADYARNTIVLPYNDSEALSLFLGKNGSKIAAIIVEPVAANIGLVPPEPDFLKTLRRLSDRDGIILIFDEVITGFRLGYGGAQEYYGIKPDLTCLGKIIGGGLPVGAYGGKRKIMEMAAPLGPVYQAGTLSGNPVAVAAGIAMLKELKKPGTYQKLAKKGAKLASALAQAATESGIISRVNSLGSMFSIFFGIREASNYDQVLQSDRELYRRFFWNMLERGIYLAPSPFETGFVSLAHSEADLDYTIGKIKETFKIINRR
ncbi:MAG: glutamate-1-semialdehyde 2,1-aminomutase [bacterium]|nr:glutamate-1-semialdehyde 2,1-aminomutase [bacterium]